MALAHGPGVMALALLLTLTAVHAAPGAVDTQELAAVRRQLLQLVNDARAKANLPALTVDPLLGEQAQRHCDAIAGGRTPFSHEGYAERFAAIRTANPTVTSMGENIGFQDAAARDKAAAMVGLWMRSASHKKNILGDFALTGMGVAAGADGRVYAVQIFCAGTPTANAKKAMESYTDESALERDIIDLVNQYRASKKLRPLAPDGTLRRLALQHTAGMASGKVRLSHDGFRDRFAELRKANPLAAAMGENVATNFPGPNAARSTVQNWINSPEHRKNMEGPEFSLTGVGVKVAKSGTIYFTQLFAKVMPAPPPPESTAEQQPPPENRPARRPRIRVTPY